MHRPLISIIIRDGAVMRIERFAWEVLQKVDGSDDGSRRIRSKNLRILGGSGRIRKGSFGFGEAHVVSDNVK